MFHYRKLYADLVTDSGLVCIAYVAELRVLGLLQRSAGYECYATDGSRTVVHARGAASVDLSAARLAIQFDTPSGAFSYELTRSGPAFDEHRLVPGLSWQVVSKVARASARGVQGFDELHGDGYSDCVQMWRPPRTLGLRSLSWGRGTAEGEPFVFTEARFRNGVTFQSAHVAGVNHESFALHTLGSSGLELHTDAASFRLEAQRVLHDGAALDALRFPRRAERGLVELLTGSVRERRALAQVTSSANERGVALYERVTFGD
jgi:hypothetical protein